MNKPYFVMLLPVNGLPGKQIQPPRPLLGEGNKYQDVQMFETEAKAFSAARENRWSVKIGFEIFKIGNGE